MRLLVLLFCASYSLGQPQPKTSQAREKDTAPDKSPSNRSIAPTVNQKVAAPIETDSESKKGEKIDSDERIAIYTEKLASYTGSLANYTFILAVVTGILIAVGVLQFVALMRQVNALSHHSVLIGDSVEQMKRAVAAYERYVGVGEQALVLTRESNDTTRDATNLTRQSFLLAHRPKLVVRSIVPTADLGVGLVPEGTFRIVNEGGTIAKIKNIFVTAELYGALPMKPLYQDNAGGPVEHLLAPGESLPCRYQRDAGAIKQQEINLMQHQNSDFAFYVFGFIRYTDELEPPTTRQTFFCRKFNRRMARFEAVDNQDYERAE